MLPLAFTKRMAQQISDYTAFEQAFSQSAPTAVRLNPFKTHYQGTQPPMPWCQRGHYLHSRPRFILDPRLHAGAYYVQDPSCMVLEAVLNALQIQPRRILDACAAPGGKSTHLASLFPDSLLIANEVIHGRLPILAENLSKWGSGHSLVIQQDPRDLGRFTDCFDLILVDAPCSGEGLFRKEPEACSAWSESHVNLCANRQQRILKSLWPALAPGGTLIYSTCTYAPEENEAQINYLLRLGAEPLHWQLDSSWGLIQQQSAGTASAQCLPHRFSGEGFFITAVQKTASAHPTHRRPIKYSKRSLEPTKATKSYQDWLLGDWHFENRHDEIWAWPASWEDDLGWLQNLMPKHPPVRLGKTKGKNLQPDIDLARSIHFAPQHWAQRQLSLSESVAYLQGEALPSETGHGLVCCTFEGWPLGWAKAVPGRLNNLYPTGQRIRMRPDEQTLQTSWQSLLEQLPITPR